MSAPLNIVGVGAYTPSNVVTTEEISAFLGRKAEQQLQESYPDVTLCGWLLEKTGIKSRRLELRLDSTQGIPIGTLDEALLAHRAAKAALGDANVPVSDINLLMFVSCTQDNGRQHYEAMGHKLHSMLGMRPNQRVLEINAGCAGAVKALDWASHFLQDGQSALIVTSSFSSQYMHRDLYNAHQSWLSIAIFGDGASAVVVHKSNQPCCYVHIEHTVSLCFPRMRLMDTRNEVAHGAPWPLYHLHGKEIARQQDKLMAHGLNGLRDANPRLDVKRAVVFPHQVNGTLLQRWATKVGVKPEYLAVNVDTRGNLAAATVFTLLHEWLQSKGGLPKNVPIIFLVLGAGADVCAAEGHAGT